MQEPSSAPVIDVLTHQADHAMRKTELISIVIVEDDTRIRDALSLIIDGTPGMVCVGAYGAVEALMEADPSCTIDLFLLDVGLPGLAGIDAIGPIRTRWPGADVLMLTVFDDAERVFRALQEGASGYLLKSTPPAQIMEAIREVYDGGAPMTPSVARKVVSFFRRPKGEQPVLSTREREVLDGLIEGKTNRQIAEVLFISPNTVAYHLKQIYEKLHVHSRAEAVAKVMRHRTRRPRP